MNDQYRELLRQYILAVNLPSLYTNVQKTAIEKKLWEVVREHPKECFSDAIRPH